jgi:hypothetical protein
VPRHLLSDGASTVCTEPALCGSPPVTGRSPSPAMSSAAAVDTPEVRARSRRHDRLPVTDGERYYALTNQVAGAAGREIYSLIGGAGGSGCRRRADVAPQGRSPTSIRVLPAPTRNQSGYGPHHIDDRRCGRHGSTWACWAGSSTAASRRPRWIGVPVTPMRWRADAGGDQGSSIAMPRWTAPTISQFLSSRARQGRCRRRRQVRERSGASIPKPLC